MTAHEISTLDYYICDLPEPEVGLPKGFFEARSYSRWAANELLTRFIKEASKRPQYLTGIEPKSAKSIIIDFINEMEYYSRKNTYTCNMFSIARSTGDDILELFRATHNYDLKGERNENA